jgi:hypothetical protein
MQRNTDKKYRCAFVSAGKIYARRNVQNFDAMILAQTSRGGKRLAIVISICECHSERSEESISRRWRFLALLEMTARIIFSAIASKAKR